MAAQAHSISTNRAQPRDIELMTPQEMRAEFEAALYRLDADQLKTLHTEMLAAIAEQEAEGGRHE